MTHKRSIAALFIGIAMLALLVSFSRDPLRKAWWGYLNNYASEYYVQQMMAFNARKDRNLPDNAVLFYGDSLVQGLAVQAAAQRAVNYGIGQAGTRDVARQLKEHLNIGKAAAVVIAVGVNDVIRANAHHVLPAYQSALMSIPDSVPVVISNILPVDEALLHQTNLNNAIQQLNQQLQKLCSTRARLTCLDAGQSLKDSEGNLASQYHTGDGLHLNTQGNSIWLSQLETSIAKASSSRGQDKNDISDKQSL